MTLTKTQQADLAAALAHMNRAARALTRSGLVGRDAGGDDDDASIGSILLYDVEPSLWRALNGLKDCLSAEPTANQQVSGGDE